MQPKTSTNTGYYISNNNLKLNQLILECDSPDNKSTNSNSPNYLKTERSESPDNQSTSQLKNNSQLNSSKNLSSNLISSTINKMSKTATNLQHCNNENNINKHNINNNLNSTRNLIDNNAINSIDKQIFLSPLDKFKKLLSSIYQHANEISNETGDRVHSIILNLINSTYSVDEFQIKIQSLINYPLRSHIINFIRNFLPGFQNEIARFARLSKQNIAQFVKQNESIFLDTQLSNSLQTLDLDELLLSASIPNQQLKRRFSPDFLLDNENFGIQSNKRFHSSLNTASPPINKLSQNGNLTQQTSINQISQSSNISKTLPNSINSSLNCSKLTANNSIASMNNNPSILHNHLTQTRTAMIEELMNSRFYQSPIQQQFNLINQHLNQQIAHSGSSLKKQTNQLLNGMNNNNLNANQINNLNSQLNGNQISNQLQANLLLNNNNQLNKQQLNNLDRLAFLERYEKELASQSKPLNLNNLRSNLEPNLHNSNLQNLRNHLPSTALNQQQPPTQLNINSLNMSTSNNLSLNQNQLPRTTNEMIANEDEWKNIDTMLSCIMNMVIKTKKALNILLEQRNNERNQENLTNGDSISPTNWPQRNNKLLLKKIPLNKNLANNNLNQLNHQSLNNQLTKSATPPIDNDYLDLRKSKDQLLSSLNFAFNPKSLNRVNAQTDLMSIDKTKMEQIFLNLRKQAAQDSIPNIQEESENSCWNCGRKALEICSGCNEASYCSQFCQSKDWETHHQNCGKNNKTASTNYQTNDQLNSLNEIPINKNLKIDSIDSPRTTPTNLTPNQQLDIEKSVDIDDQSSEEKDNKDELEQVTNNEITTNVDNNSDTISSTSNSTKNNQINNDKKEISTD